MALSVVYFRITHRLGRPHYVRVDYLYSVLEKVEVRVTVSVVLLCCADYGSYIEINRKVIEL